MRETRYGVCSARNEVRSLQCEKRETEFEGTGIEDQELR